MKGMTCSVYRAADGSDCTNGPSRTCDELTLVGEGVPQLVEPTADCPAFRFVKREIFSKQRPFVQPDDEKHYQFGGNFLHCCDSRFPWDFPLPIHDRDESRMR